MTHTRRILPVVLAAALVLGGCAGQESDYDAAAAEHLQAEVLEVSELSAAADYPSALLALVELEVSLKDALARGQLTQERYDSILAAAALVRTDLEAAIAAQAPPEPEPEPEEPEEKEKPGKGNKGKGNPGKGNDDD